MRRRFIWRKDNIMESILAYIFTPETLISLISTIIWMSVAWTALKWRVDQIERDVKELQGYELHIKIAEMQKDIQYMRETQTRIEKLLSQK
jgi:hypothetical protein